MKFKSKQVKGKGRGKLLGFPTINLEIPKNLNLEDGIYAVKVFIRGKAPLISGQSFIGALHFGPIPTFNEADKTLEVFLIDTPSEELPETENIDIEIETSEFLRPVLNFKSETELVKQISEDVIKTKQVFGKVL